MIQLHAVGITLCSDKVLELLKWSLQGPTYEALQKEACLSKWILASNQHKHLRVKTEKLAGA